jgi:glycosyltransferase involved in cell wall biosynthesis
MIEGGLITRGIKKFTNIHEPLISVITVVYNGHETLQRTIESVLNQTYKNIEYIIIDGESTDGTIDIIKKYDNILSYWLSESDKGIYYAMNKGAALATGEYIAYLNSDDWYEPEICEIIAGEINKIRHDIYYGMIRVFDRNNKLQFVSGFTDNYLKNNMIAHPTCFVSKDIYKNYKYDTKYKSVSDYDFILRLKKQNKTFYFIEKILANFSLGGISNSIVGEYETNEIMRKYTNINFAKYIYKKLLILLKSLIRKR